MEKLVELFLKYRNLILPMGILGCILVVLIPLPPALLDLLLVSNIAISVLVLLTTMSVATPVEFSIFPSVLLATTLMRLALNIATTRLILTQDSSGPTAVAGHVVEGFGNFMTGDKIEVGLLLFVIIFIINFVVITKGATRIGEVAARFALDGMPGKQLAIDSDLNAGLINASQAHERRIEVTRHADFYGAMDGASKFVRGDAVAGLIITALNLLGGLYVGVAYFGLSLPQAAVTYSKLTIGDGLATQLPALLISVGAALLTTRSAHRSDFSAEFLGQLFAKPLPLMIAGVFLALLVLTSLPATPLLALGSGAIGIAFLLRKNQLKEASSSQLQADRLKESTARTTEKKTEDYLNEDAIRLELGASLIPLVDPARGSDIMKKITAVRTHLASDLGILLPMVRIKDRLNLPSYQYEISLLGNVIASASLVPERLLAISNRNKSPEFEGDPTRDPATGRPAYWIAPDDRTVAERTGFRVLDCAQVIANHLHRIAEDHAAELLTREVTKQLIDQVHKTHATIVEELIPNQLKLSEVQQILRNLLDEQVPIRPLSLILETIGDLALDRKDTQWLTERVRERLGRTLCHRLRDSRNRISAITLDPSIEDGFASLLDAPTRQGTQLVPPSLKRALIEQLREFPIESHTGTNPIVSNKKPIVLLVNPEIRTLMRRTLRETFPRLPILATTEITSDTLVESIALIELPESSLADSMRSF